MFSTCSSVCASWIGLCSWDHLGDRWSWRYATIDRDPDRYVSAPWWIKSKSVDNCKTVFSSLTSSGRECNLIVGVVWQLQRPIKDTWQALLCRISNATQTLMLVTSLPSHPTSHPTRPIVLLKTTVGGWTLTWHSLQMAGRITLQPYSVLVNGRDQEF